MQTRDALGLATPFRRGLWFAAAAAVFVLTAVTGSAASPLQLEWDELGTLSGKTVRMVAADGTVITGTIKGVSPDALLLDVRQTTNPRSIAKGPAKLDRAGILDFEVRTKRKVFRIIGTAAGSFAGLIGGIGTAFSVGSGPLSKDGKQAAAVFGMWAGGTVAGYFAGNAADARWTPVKILKQGSPSERQIIP